MITSAKIKAHVKYRNDMGQLFLVDRHNAHGTIAFLKTLHKLEVITITRDPWLNNDHFVVEFIHE
jgi:hypothetical protein